MAKQPAHLGRVMAYVDGILDGSIIANVERKQACERFKRDLQDPHYDFRPKSAEFVIGIIEKTLVHVKGPLLGQPFLLLDWELFVVYNVAGFYLAGTQERRFKESFIFIPRKNGKTPFAAALAWGLTLLDRSQGATLGLVGSSLQQALESFNVLVKNIRAMGEEDEWIIHDSQNDHSIYRAWTDNQGKETGFVHIKAFASDPERQDSFNMPYAICDEIHAYRKPKQYLLFKQAQKAYINKHLFGITTAGDKMPSFCYQRLQYCLRVLRGEIADEQYFIFICRADNSDDYTNPVEHEKANPSYGVTIRPHEMLATSIQAQHDPSSRADFLCKELNIYVNAANAYFDLQELQKSDTACDQKLGFEPEDSYQQKLAKLAKLPITWYGGADLSKMFDLTGAALYGRYNGIDILVAHGFMPITQAYRKAEEDDIPFFGWKDDGWLTLCNGDVIEYADVVKWFENMRKLGFRFKIIGYDRRYSREFIKLMKLAGFQTVDQSQRYVDTTEAFREIEKQIKRSAFYYLENGAVLYCFSNVKAVEMPGEFIQFSKVEETQRIDLFTAGVIGCKQMLIQTEKSNKAKQWTE